MAIIFVYTPDLVFFRDSKMIFTQEHSFEIIGTKICVLLTGSLTFYHRLMSNNNHKSA